MRIEKSEIIGSLEAGAEGTRLEVALTESGSEPMLSLQLSTWNEALGWQVQKTIPLEAKQLGQLQRLLSRARGRISDRLSPPGLAAQVIPLEARGHLAQAPLPAAQSRREREDLAS